MIDFNSKLAKIHREIQQDTGLVRRIYEIAEREGLRTKTHSKVYFPVETFNGIPLGIDLNKNHHSLVYEILAKMRILYEVSEGNADLLCIYASLDNYSGILSEDISNGGKIKIDDFVGDKFLNEVIIKVFLRDSIDGFRRTTFYVDDNITGRMPIVDLDHVSVRPEFDELFKKYTSEYENNPDFIIKKK